MSHFFRQLVDKIEVFSSPQVALDHCRALLAQRGRLSLAFANAHAFNLGRANPQFGSNLLACDLVLRDGIGVKWLLAALGRDPGYNLNGTDLIPQLLPALFNGKRLAIYGARDQELAVAGPKLSEQGLEVVDSCHGFCPDHDYLERIAACQPDVVLLAMGMPKQERVADAIARRFEQVSVINGGAIVDFMAGKVSRAPQWVRRMGAEWLYRLMLEPRRLFKRYVVGNAVFLFHAMRLARHQTNGLGTGG